MTRSWKHRTTLFQVWMWRRDACKGPEVGVLKREYALKLQTTLLLIKIQETIFLHALASFNHMSLWKGMIWALKHWNNPLRYIFKCIGGIELYLKIYSHDKVESCGYGICATHWDLHTLHRIRWNIDSAFVMAHGFSGVYMENKPPLISKYSGWGIWANILSKKYCHGFQKDPFLAAHCVLKCGFTVVTGA